MTLVTSHMRGTSRVRLGQLWILEASWQSDAMPEGPDTLVRSPDLHQEIDNRYVVEKQPRRVSWGPELALEGARTLNAEPVSSCYEQHVVRVWCHRFMTGVTKSWLNIVSVISTRCASIMKMNREASGIDCYLLWHLNENPLERSCKWICYHPNEAICVSSSLVAISVANDSADVTRIYLK